MICGADTERPFRKEWKIKDMRRDTIGCAGIILMTQQTAARRLLAWKSACVCSSLPALSAPLPNNIYIYYIYIVGNDTISSVQVGSSVTRMMLFHSPYRPFNCDRIVTGRNIEKIERFFVSLCYRAISTVISFFLRKQCRDDFSSKRFYQSYRSNGLENRSWKFVSCESRFRREVQRYLRICLHRWRIFI